MPEMSGLALILLCRGSRSLEFAISKFTWLRLTRDLPGMMLQSGGRGCEFARVLLHDYSSSAMLSQSCLLYTAILEMLLLRPIVPNRPESS